MNLGGPTHWLPFESANLAHSSVDGTLHLGSSYYDVSWPRLGEAHQVDHRLDACASSDGVDYERGASAIIMPFDLIKINLQTQS